MARVHWLMILAICLVVSREPLPAAGDGAHLFVAGNYDEAIEVGKNAVTRLGRTYGTDSVAVAAAHHTVATYLEGRGDYVEAARHCQRAQHIVTAQLGKTHRNMGSVYTTLAAIEIGRGRLAAAEQACRAGMAILRGQVATRQRAARLLQVMAELRCHQYRYNEAETLARRAVGFREAAAGNKTYVLSEARRTLARAMAGQGRLVEAGNLAHAVLVAQRALGPNHPEQAATMGLLADIACQLENYRGVDELFAKQRTLWQRRLGPGAGASKLAWSAAFEAAAARGARQRFQILAREFETTVLSKGDGTMATMPAMETLLCARGLIALYNDRLDEGRQAFQRALALVRESHGGAGPALAAPLMGLGRLAIVDGRPADGRAACQQALQCLRSRGTTEHPAIARCLLLLAEAHMACGDASEAQGSLAAARTILQATVGESSPSHAAIISREGEIQKGLGEFTRAKALFSKALAQYARHLGSASYFEIRLRWGLASLALERNLLPDAAEELRQALAIAQRWLLPRCANIARLQCQLALVLGSLLQVAEAKKLMSLGLPILKQRFGPDDGQVLACERLLKGFSAGRR